MDTFRKKYRDLSPEEKQAMETIKTKAEELLAEFNKVVPQEERSERSRCVSLGRTKLEEAIMWAVKGITL